MNKLIKEEINRIKEVMGLKLLTEGVIPSGSLKLLLKNLLGQGFEESLNKIGSALPTEKTGETLELIKSLRASTDETVRNLMRSVEEVAIRDYDGLSSELFDDLINGKLSDEVEEEILQKIASKSIGIDPRLMTVLPSNFAEKVRFINKLRNDLVTKDLKKVRGTYADKETYQSLLNQFEKTRAEIEALPGENSLFKRELLNKFNNYTRLFDDVVSGKITKIVDEAEALSNDIPLNRIRLDDADMNRLRNSESSIQVPEGPIKDFATLKFKRFKKLSPEQQKDLVDQVVAETLAANNKTIATFRSQGVALEDAQETFSNPQLGPVEKMKILRNAINKVKPSLGVGQDAVDWLVNYLVGYNMKNEEWLWTNGGWKKVLYNWFLINAGFAVVEFITRGVLTKGEDPDKYGNDDIERFINRFDFVGLLLRVIPVPGLARLILSEGVQAVIESGGFRPPSSEEVLKQFPGASKKNVNEHPKYQDNISLLAPRLDDSVWIVRGNEDLGIWYWNLDTDKMENVLPGSSSSSSTQTTTTYEASLIDFKKFLKDSGLSDTDAVNDTEESGYFVANGKDYVYDDSTKTFKVDENE